MKRKSSSGNDNSTAGEKTSQQLENCDQEEIEECTVQTVRGAEASTTTQKKEQQHISTVNHIELLKEAPPNGSCHKCGGSFFHRILRAPIGRCRRCRIYFHTSDCGSRFRIVHMSTDNNELFQCPKCISACACVNGKIWCNAAKQLAAKRRKQSSSSSQLGDSDSRPQMRAQSPVPPVMPPVMPPVIPPVMPGWLT